MARHLQPKDRPVQAPTSERASLGGRTLIYGAIILMIKGALDA